MLIGEFYQDLFKGSKMAQRNQKRDPNKTKTGKTRLGGLTVSQLTVMVEKEGKKKIKAKILNQIRIVTSRKGYVEKVVSTEVTE
jgi:hypothetical protein